MQEAGKLKHIYFIRHGETLKNRGHIHQGPDEPLTELGKAQAREVATALQDRQIDTLITSNYVRARETGAIIGDILDMPYTIDESVKEFRRPNRLYGKHHYSFDSFRYIWNLYWHRTDPDWDNDGAENMYHVRNRIYDVKDMVAEIEGQHVAIVSHAIFMDMFTEIVCNEKPLSIYKFAHGLLMTKRIPNTGMLHFTYNPAAAKGQCAWQLVEIIHPTLATEN